MSGMKQRRLCGADVGVALLMLAGGAGAALGQETPTQDTKPPAQEQPPDTAAAPQKQEPRAVGATTQNPKQEEPPGSPKDTSAGGSERKPPESAGLFSWGPISLIEDPIRKAQTWMSEKARLDFGARAAFTFQQASGGTGERTAVGQDYRIYGTWHAFNWQEDKKGYAGNVYARVEYRQEMFTKINPFQLNTQIGTLFTTTYGFDAHDLALVQLYYEQYLADGKLRLRAGKIDPDDYFNLGRWADDYRYFMNTLFSAFPASNHPSGGLGMNAQWYITPEWTLTGGFSDVQGRKVTSGFDTFPDGKFIYGLDVTYSPTFDGLGKGNYRLGYEYRDAVEDLGRPEDSSIYINIDQEVAKDIAPFLRYNWGTGNSTGVDNVFSVGIGFDNVMGRQGDAFGVGIGFDTKDSSVVSTRDVEYATEAFYRMQLTPAMQYTLGGQLIYHPVLKPDDQWVAVFEMRLVIDF
jgi:porin